MDMSYYGKMPFKNLYESINDYMKNNDLDFNNFEKKLNSNALKNDSTLNEIYYIVNDIFLIYYL